MEPMINVNNLVKRYAGVTALRNVSFEVQRGEIVGFLGPNGAGKSTTMRILTGFLPASSGVVQVAGLDVFENSLEVRRHIGYMPESNPLYDEMRVGEYLKFRSKLKGVPRGDRSEQISYALERCGLQDVERRVIGQLSKGFRQRVGLADAMLAEPDLLILDEPTIGLDPVQIRQVRQLIKDLGQKHTILLSSHILHEVEMTCNRVLILYRGRILASDKPENLRKTLGRGETIHVEVRGPREVVVEELGRVPGVRSVAVGDDAGEFLSLTIEPERGADPREEMFRLIASRSWTLRELSHSRTTLEDIFVQITRDEDEAEEERRELGRSLLR
jgi:ABC-2 type transport system ATP-binding protein